MSCTNRRALVFVVSGAVLFAGCASVTPVVPPPAPAQSQPQQPAATAVVAPKVDGEWQTAYERALGLLKAGQLAEAERALRSVSEREPELAGPHANLGILYHRLARPADAIRELERAIVLNARAAYYNELGVLYRTEGRFDAAEGAYSEALVLEPDYAYAHLNLGILYDLYLQKPDKALSHYERYQALMPGEAATVGKWIADLKRRSSQAAEQNRGGESG